MEKNNKAKKVYVKVPARFHLDVMDIQKLEESKIGGGGIGIAKKLFKIRFKISCDMPTG